MQDRIAENRKRVAESNEPDWLKFDAPTREREQQELLALQKHPE